MLSEHIKMAIASIRASRFRSFLTMLGIIIGVVSVITTASLGEGVKQQIAGQASSVGPDLITVRPGKLVERDDEGNVSKLNLLSFLSTSAITEKDIETIQKDPNVERVVPLSIISGTPSVGDDKYDQAFIMATNEHLPEMISQKIEFGNFFEGSDNNRRVAIIGKNVAEQLFKENVPISKSMKIRGEEFVVSGVFERTATNPVSPDADYNDAIFIPYAVGKDLAKSELEPYEVLVRPKAKDSAMVDKTISNITQSLNQNHGEEDFTVLRQEDVVAVADNLLKLVTSSVGIMAAVALLVGGVGIVNVMLVSVTERTREIGIRKTVGATNSQIRTQFLTEAVVISAWGVLWGLLISGIINLLFRIFTFIEPVITWQTVLLVSVVSITVGVVFGTIPALKAARKDPIEALRTD